MTDTEKETPEQRSEARADQSSNEQPEFTPEQKNKLLEGWMQSALEFDKSLLAVASAGLGLIAALTDKFQKGPDFVPAVLAVSALAFAVVICAVLAIFRVNKIYLSAPSRSRRETISSHWLTILDVFTPIVFVIAIGGTLVATSGLLLHKEKPVNPRDEEMLELLRKVESGELKPTLESLNTIKDLMRQQNQVLTSNPPPPPKLPASGNDNKGSGGNK